MHIPCLSRTGRAQKGIERDAPDVAPLDKGGLASQIRNENYDAVCSAAFLETILLQEPYRRALPRQGVCIEGARFEEAIDLAFARLGHMLCLHRTRFEQEVQLAGLHSSDVLSLGGSYFAGALTMSAAQIESHLNLISVRCTGPLRMTNLELKGNLLMDSLEV